MSDHPTFPLQEHLGFTVTGADGSGTASVDLDERHMNPNGIAHGTVVFTMMDTAMGAAVMSVLDEGSMCATIEIQTRFHRAATSGSLRSEASVLQAGRRIIHLEAKTFDGDGRLISSATGSFAVLAPQA